MCTLAVRNSSKLARTAGAANCHVPCRCRVPRWRHAMPLAQSASGRGLKTQMAGAQSCIPLSTILLRTSGPDTCTIRVRAPSALCQYIVILWWVDRSRQIVSFIAPCSCMVTHFCLWTLMNCFVPCNRHYMRPAASWLFCQARAAHLRWVADTVPIYVWHAPNLVEYALIRRSSAAASTVAHLASNVTGSTSRSS